MFDFFKKTKKTNEKELEILFESQIKKLKELNLDDQLLKELRDQKKEVLRRALNIDYNEEDLCFFPVIPRKILGLDYLLSLIKGSTAILESDLSDLEEEPERPYFIFKINKGDNNFGKKAQSKKDGALNLAETIFWLIQEKEDIPNINCLGTKYSWASPAKFNVTMFLIKDNKSSNFKLYMGKIYAPYYFVPRGIR